MKKILMIGTGGTIASLQTEDGLAPGLTPADILSHIPAVKDVCEVHTMQVCNLDSTNVTPEHWKLMVHAVEENYYKYDGFVICHGTDTLAYTAAAALAFWSIWLWKAASTLPRSVRTSLCRSLL